MRSLVISGTSVLAILCFTALIVSAAEKDADVKSSASKAETADAKEQQLVDLLKKELDNLGQAEKRGETETGNANEVQKAAGGDGKNEPSDLDVDTDILAAARELPEDIDNKMTAADENGEEPDPDVSIGERDGIPPDPDMEKRDDIPAPGEGPGTEDGSDDTLSLDERALTKTAAIRKVNNIRGTFTADNSMRLYADGAQVGTDNGNWVRATQYSYPQGTRVIAIRAVDLHVVAGILGAVGNGIVTDEKWKCTNRYYYGWAKPNFNDASWPNARTYGYNRATTQPWRRVITGIPSNAKWIWTNKNRYSSNGDRIVYCRRHLRKEDSCSLCRYLKAYCRSSVYVRRYCPKTCSCTDKSSYSACLTWKRRGYCKTYSSVWANCKKTCNNCNNQPFCGDRPGTYSSQCRSNRLNCRKYIYYTYYCPKTCHSCKAVCRDTTSTCVTWARRGLCKYSYYYSKCRKACNRCI